MKPRDGRDGKQGLRGLDGDPGQDGQPGLDAYQIAVQRGYVGTRDEWSRSLVGPQGARGADGRDGKDGEAGKDGTRGADGLAGRDGKDGGRGFRGLVGKAGETGPAGDDGWTPLLAVVEDGERRVHQVIDWWGGEGTKPLVGFYLGPKGGVERIEDATDLRGAPGIAGRRSGGGVGTSLQQVFIGTLPVITYPAVGFELRSDGQYTMQVHVP